MQRLDETAIGALRMLLDRQPTNAAKVKFAWTIAAGATLARAATVSWSDDGTLAVVARTEQWRAELARVRPLITQRMAALLGAGVVRRIVLRPATGSRDAPTPA